MQHKFFHDQSTKFIQTKLSLIEKLSLHLAGFSASEKELAQLQQFGFRRFFLKAKSDVEQIVERAKIILERSRLLEHTIISFESESYPALLREISNPPFILFAKGKIELLNKPGISMVGTRKPSPLGMHLAQKVSRELSKQYVVVSGLARGIDINCHEPALKNQGTIAVIAHGLNHIYPNEHHYIYQKVSEGENLCIISEYAADVKPLRFHFPKRNRIISGLSKKTIMVEGGRKSGALITCNYALEQGRDVIAAYHKFLTNNSGGEGLVKQGALNIMKHFRLDEVDFYGQDKVPELTLNPDYFYLGDSYWACIEDFDLNFLSA